MQSSRAATEQAPGREVPVPLQEVWLRFHEEELCQGMDAVFTFNNDGLQVHSLIENEKSYEKFQQMLQPLRNSYKIELSAERPEVEKDPEEGKNPPASLWENYELRSFLGDPFARAKERPGFETRTDLPPPGELLKQQLVIYSEQTLDWNSRMERYATDLPALAHAAFDPSSVPALRTQAAAICRAHVQAMEKYISKLKGNLAEALPKGDRNGRSYAKPDSRAVSSALVNKAEDISGAARDIAHRIRAFIHPEIYTVGLDELRQPSLLDLMNSLRKMNLEFLKSMDKAGRS